jgi:hypothetical protein
MESKECMVCGKDKGDRALLCEDCWKEYGDRLFDKHFVSGMKPEKARELIRQDLIVMIRNWKLEAI